MAINTKSKFQTLVILDLETTGLVYDEPKITELALIAVHVSTLDDMKADEELPRILNKFVKFFNPGKEIRGKAAKLSDLDNQMLKNYSTFNHTTVLSIEKYLNDFPQPICLIAHNGNIFDFPILYNEIKSHLSTNDSSLTSIACADSIHFFREIYRLLNEENITESKSELNKNHTAIDSAVGCIRHGYVEIPMKTNAIQQLPSMKLNEIYQREFNKQPNLKSHRAEDDCLMLLAIIKRYLPDWLEWIDGHTRILNDFFYLPKITNTSHEKSIALRPRLKL